VNVVLVTEDDFAAGSNDHRIQLSLDLAINSLDRIQEDIDRSP
jgi:hypothetical protein